MPIFILDFLCIHPFNDGNGRMSRLLTLLLLYRAGFIVGKYISIEMLIEKSKDSYYEALQASSQDWHEDGNNYLPFLKYMLGVVVKAYNEFENRVEHLRYRKISKPERIKAIIERTPGKITKKEISQTCPDISLTTIERTLSDLLAAGYIEKTGTGRANLTGAGLGMKSPRNRNFEAGILTDEPSLVEAAMSQFDTIWAGFKCKDCGRKQYCSDPIRER